MRTESDVVATVEAEELTEVVLVGHSYAATVVAGVAGQVPEKIAHIVYVDSLPPEEGRSLFDAAPAAAREAMEAAAEAMGGGWRLPMVSDSEFAQYHGDHRLSAADLRWLRAHAVGHPIGTQRQPLAIGDPAAVAALPRTFVRCTGTPYPSPVQPGQASWGYAELPTGHWPMITMPAELASLLEALPSVQDTQR